jgi:hypothetical protein
MRHGAYVGRYLVYARCRSVRIPPTKSWRIGRAKLVMAYPLTGLPTSPMSGNTHNSNFDIFVPSSHSEVQFSPSDLTFARLNPPVTTSGDARRAQLSDVTQCGCDTRQRQNSCPLCTSRRKLIVLRGMLIKRTGELEPIRTSKITQLILEIFEYI